MTQREFNRYVAILSTVIGGLVLTVIVDVLVPGYGWVVLAAAFSAAVLWFPRVRQGRLPKNIVARGADRARAEHDRPSRVIGPRATRD